jgi:dTDP-4-amino-4,6-dideoxygalactose transaminase
MRWRWKQGPETDELRENLNERFHGSSFLFSSGRESLLALFRSMNLKPGEEIVVQGYTCMVIPNAIHSAGGTPVYVDIDRDTLNLDCDEVEHRITPRTRAIICQHTFGIPADITRLRSICDARHILLIEDCAHIIPDTKGPTIGNLGDAVLLSFGRDKAISGISGGALIARRDELTAKLRAEEQNAEPVPIIKIVQWLNYPQAYFLARPFMGMKIGFAFLKVLRMMRLLSPVLTDEEKEGTMSPVLHAMPNVCAALALAELNDLPRINNHRRMLTAQYLEAMKQASIEYPKSITTEMPLQKFPIFVKNAASIRSQLKKKNIHLDDGWTGCVVCPASSNIASAGYVPGSDPDAENASTMILSLPTHPTMTEKLAEELLSVIQSEID